jgi:6-pyruvoyltetrahydropterin/6-carboxytetrahydropterin synthase
MQLISRKGNFDSGHRVMNEAMKCFNIHGHTYLYNLSFQHENMEDIGYAIDFKEIKRVFCQWIDDILDHGMLLNAKDKKLIQTTKDYESKLWLMSLNGAGEYCNPSVENITREVFLAIDIMCSYLYPDENIGLKLHSVEIFETPNCASKCFRESISKRERVNFLKVREKELINYADSKGVKEYDDRK